ncbi:hypothetical protein FQN50_008382 [Emmonsiellopsis sp. PD_5]|nr:hypothetical protein FQN50_008382 [Emmonsiellopsis sp. PD_5]
MSRDQYARYQQPPDGRLQYGMYASSPVYFAYPRDLTGGRASEHTILQYVSPEDRRQQEMRRALQQQQQYEEACRSRRVFRPARTTTTTSNEPSQRDTGHHESPPKEGVGPENRDSSPQTRPPRRQLTIVWICCQNCSYPGPYSSLYAKCIGCEAPKCPNCREELVPAQESPLREG